MRYLAECREFYREFRRQYRNTGSILPSSRALGRALVSELRRRPGPARILEVGPGTGAVTIEILDRLRPGDQFDIVEINSHFVEVLKRRFDEDPPFRRRRGQVRIIHAPVQQVEGKGVYDYMVSGLPLNNFPVPLVEEIFAAFRRLLKPEGVLSYFEYLAIRRVKMLLVGREARQRLRELSAYLEPLIAE